MRQASIKSKSSLAYVGKLDDVLKILALRIGVQLTKCEICAYRMSHLFLIFSRILKFVILKNTHI